MKNRSVRKRRLPHVAASLALGLVLASSAPAGAEVLFRGDFESGDLKGWGGPAVGHKGVSVVTEPVRSGKYALRIDGSNAARRGERDRIELQHQPPPEGTAEGAERYYAWSVMFPKTPTPGVHNAGYFEARNVWRQLMSFEVRGEDILYTTRVPYARRWEGKGKFTPAKWHDFVVHVHWSRDPEKGFVEVWYDGELVVPKTATATLLDDNRAFLQLGLMRQTSETPETLYLDHIMEGTTLEDVKP